MKKAPFIVSLVADLRPVVDRINRVLAERGSPRVGPDELPEVDTMLQAALTARPSEESRCAHCGGYFYTDGSGEHICLNCGRAMEASRPLAVIVDEIVGNLLERRKSARTTPRTDRSTRGRRR